MVFDDALHVEVEDRSNVTTLSGEVDRRIDSDILARGSREVDGVVDGINL